VELIILVGLQASGKSTFVRERFEASHTIVSKDNFAQQPPPGAQATATRRGCSSRRSIGRCGQHQSDS